MSTFEHICIVLERERNSMSLAIRLFAKWAYVESILVWFFMIYVMMWNMDTLPSITLHLPPLDLVYAVEPRAKFNFLSPTARKIGLALRIDQNWSLFAPNPDPDEGWFVVPGRTRDGNVVDVMSLLSGRSKTVNWRKPDTFDEYSSKR